MLHSGGDPGPPYTLLDGPWRVVEGSTEGLLGGLEQLEPCWQFERDIVWLVARTTDSRPFAGDLRVEYGADHLAAWLALGEDGEELGTIEVEPIGGALVGSSDVGDEFTLATSSFCDDLVAEWLADAE